MSLLARFETKGGKQWLELYQTELNNRQSYSYRGNNCGGNLGYKNSKEEVIECFIDNQVKFLKLDYPSIKRVI